MRTKCCFLLPLLIFVMTLAGCTQDASVKTIYEMSEKNGIVFTYYEMNDNTWKCNDTVYQYRLKLSGTMPSAAANSEFVVLTNDNTLDFETVTKSLYSSSYDDGEKLASSVIVEIH